MRQNEGESVAQYHVRLRLQVAKSSFTDPDDVIRSKILQTMRDKKLLRVAMVKRYTLQQLLEHAANKEDIDRQSQHMEETLPLHPPHEIRSTKCIKRDTRNPRTNQSLDRHMMTRRAIPANSVGWTTKVLSHSAQPLEKHVVPAQRRVISLACAKAKRK